MVEPDQRLPCFVEFTRDDARNIVVYALAFSPSLCRYWTERGVNRAPLPCRTLVLTLGRAPAVPEREGKHEKAGPPTRLSPCRTRIGSCFLPDNLGLILYSHADCANRTRSHIEY